MHDKKIERFKGLNLAVSKSIMNKNDFGAKWHVNLKIKPPNG
jgi:hypothetical protein